MFNFFFSLSWQKICQIYCASLILLFFCVSSNTVSVNDVNILSFLANAKTPIRFFLFPFKRHSIEINKFMGVKALYCLEF